MSLIRTVIFWSFAWTYTMFIFIALFVSVGICRLRNRRMIPRVAHYFAGLWARGFFKIIPGWSIDITGLEKLPPTGTPVVFISNHQSMADIWAMYCLGRDFCWLSKDDVFRLPMLGKAMKWADYIPIERSNRSSASQALDASRNQLIRGRSMFFFPEGTRSTDGQVLPFKIGAFKLADELGIAIVPITIHGAGRLMPKGSLIPNRSRVQLRIDDPTNRRDNEGLNEYAARVRQTIIGNLLKSEKSAREDNKKGPVLGPEENLNLD